MNMLLIDYLAPFQALINFVIWVIGVATLAVGIGVGFVLVAIVHAVVTVNSKVADKRNAALIEAINSSKK